MKTNEELKSATVALPSEEGDQEEACRDTLDIISVKESPCSYFFKEKGQYGVLVFSGVLKANSRFTFDEAQMTLLKSDAVYIIISLSGVDAIDLFGIRQLAKLQKSIRDDGKKLRISGADNIIKDKLLASGTVREDELKLNIKDAIKGFIKSKKIANNRSRKKS